MMSNFANVWVNSMKVVTLTTVPNILPFFQAELSKAVDKLVCRNFHFGHCNWVMIAPTTLTLQVQEDIGASYRYYDQPFVDCGVVLQIL